MNIKNAMLQFFITPMRDKNQAETKWRTLDKSGFILRLSSTQPEPRNLSKIHTKMALSFLYSNPGKVVVTFLYKHERRNLFLGT